MSTTNESKQESNRVPYISLPKGDGVIRGIGENFAATTVTGTGSMRVPIFTILVAPVLAHNSLSYDSGSGNGPFGFGWDLSLPTVTRKTDKGLPQYCDAEESDVFILSGNEDLVPLLVFENDQWQPGKPGTSPDGTSRAARSYTKYRAIRYN